MYNWITRHYMNKYYYLARRGIPLSQLHAVFIEFVRITPHHIHYTKHSFISQLEFALLAFYT